MTPVNQNLFAQNITSAAVTGLSASPFQFSLTSFFIINSQEWYDQLLTTSERFPDGHVFK